MPQYVPYAVSDTVNFALLLFELRHAAKKCYVIDSADQIAVIKMVRAACGISLLDAKKIVDKAMTEYSRYAAQERVYSKLESEHYCQTQTVNS